MMKRMIALGLTALLWAACGKSEDSKPAEQPVAAEAPATAVAQADDTRTPAEPEATGDEATAGDADELPTAVDFEDEAAAEITAENLESELSRLEKELGE